MAYVYKTYVGMLKKTSVDFFKYLEAYIYTIIKYMDVSRIMCLKTETGLYIYIFFK